MEAKTFVKALKTIKTKDSKKGAEEEKKSVLALVDKVGGKLEALALCKEAGTPELTNYLRGMIGVIKVSVEEDGLAYSEAGNVYQIDDIKKTCRKVYRSFSDMKVDGEGEMNMATYQSYLKDRFAGEDAPIKKGKLHFRDYRISCDAENGFMIEDSKNHYELVETPFEGIPTPKELGDWFEKPARTFTSEELAEAVERGKKKEVKTKVEEVIEVDYEKCRKQVLRTIKKILDKKSTLEPEKFVEMIPFKRWQRNVRKLLKSWKAKQIRYQKFLKEVMRITEEETFSVEEKNHRSAFVGTLLPEFKEVGMLDGAKIQVDGKWIEAVPFLMDYLLHYEPKAMTQIMRYARKEITLKQLLKNPIDVDWKEEYNKKLLANSVENVRALGMVYEALGIIAPQDMLYKTDLKVGDKVILFIEGELKTKVVREIEKGVLLSGGIGLTKYDKWFKVAE